MSRRKGLSHEEKRSKMLELLYEKKDFFMLKELEKMAPKEKGVISQVSVGIDVKNYQSIYYMICFCKILRYM